MCMCVFKLLFHANSLFLTLDSPILLFAAIERALVRFFRLSKKSARFLEFHGSEDSASSTGSAFCICCCSLIICRSRGKPNRTVCPDVIKIFMVWLSRSTVSFAFFPLASNKICAIYKTRISHAYPNGVSLLKSLLQHVRTLVIRDSRQRSRLIQAVLDLLADLVQRLHLAFVASAIAFRLRLNALQRLPRRCTAASARESSASTDRRSRGRSRIAWSARRAAREPS